MDQYVGPDPEPVAAQEPGPLRSLLALSLDTLRTRLELAAVEVELFALRIVKFVVWAVAAVACVLLAIVFGLVTLIVALWDTHRYAGLAGAGVALLVLGGLCALLGARGIRQGPGILAGTLEQFERDHHKVTGT